MPPYSQRAFSPKLRNFGAVDCRTRRILSVPSENSPEKNSSRTLFRRSNAADRPFLSLQPVQSRAASETNRGLCAASSKDFLRLYNASLQGSAADLMPLTTTNAGLP